MADVDLDESCTLNKKIRNAQLAQYNFILGTLSLYVFFQMPVFLVVIPKKQNEEYGSNYLIFTILLFNTCIQRRVLGQLFLALHMNPVVECC
jgi:hypothetical protein